MKSLKMMKEVEVRLHFEGKSIRLGNVVIDAEKEWKQTWQKVETCLPKAMESRRIENYKANSEYLQRHNRALMVAAVTWVKEYKLVGGDVV